MEMFAELMKNMYGISLQEFAVMAIGSITYLIALVMVVFSFIKLVKVTKSINAKGALLSLLATIVSSFLAVSSAENSEILGMLEIAVLLVPSIFTLLSAICFYRLSNELVCKYSKQAKF
ncbi:hypothetical protein, partial [Alishewanella longhuensis]|uniref:hypothetical protein n=1 Tax=Alishewanella longhuensis TaxID=1091037 RepID=UPI001E49F5F7